MKIVLYSAGHLSGICKFSILSIFFLQVACLCLPQAIHHCSQEKAKQKHLNFVTASVFFHFLFV
jgi:hypothetical protein